MVVKRGGGLGPSVHQFFDKTDDVAVWPKAEVIACNITCHTLEKRERKFQGRRVKEREKTAREKAFDDSGSWKRDELVRRML